MDKSTDSTKNKCLGCYDTLESGLYHGACSRKLFGTTVPPFLQTTSDELQNLAHKFINARVAVPGVQRKISLSFMDSTKTRLTVVGSLGGAFIMKPQTPDHAQLPENEDLCMHLARICKIKTAHHGLLPMMDGSLAYVTRRFDRVKKQKIAVEDLCQLAELLTEQKYRSSHERVGKLIRQYSSVPGDDVLRFFELVIFSYVIGNNDMHLKNFSMLTADTAQIMLSPAYDLLSVRLVLSEKDDPEELALTTNGKKHSLKLGDFNTLAENLKIPLKVSRQTILRQIEVKDQMFVMVEKSFLKLDLQEKLKKTISSRLVVLGG